MICKHALGFALIAAVVAACGGPANTRLTSAQKNEVKTQELKARDERIVAEKAVTPEGLMDSIQALSSDALEGRKPGTRGEDRTVDYLVARFKSIGLLPGNPDGSYIQPVSLIGITGEADLRMSVKGMPLLMRQGDDYVAASVRFLPDVDVGNSPLVFVGYGVQAPEYGWDDYKGLDVAGKTLVMLINDPPVPDPKNPQQLDDKVFKGKGMTYYGRWTYKYDIASKLGAAAVLIIHETEPAAYPWAVVRNSWGGNERFELDADHRNLKRVPVQGWLTVDKSRELFAAAGQDFDQLKAKAARRDFSPVALDAKMTVHVRNVLRTVESRNVVGRIAGSDEIVGRQNLIYSAHWDHFGRDESLTGDQIFNGAVDNASGVGGLIEIAKAFKALPSPPKRSVLFLAVTAEEQGLLGSRAYAAQPLYPLLDTLADINMDSLNVWGPTDDVQVIGSGQNTLEDALRQSAVRQNRRVLVDKSPERGGFYRSDQFEFAKAGVPGLYTGGGETYLGKPEGWGQAKRAEYIAHDYHKTSDEIKADWDLSGAVMDLRLLFDVGARLSGDGPWPAWKDGSEFKALRGYPPAQE